MVLKLFSCLSLLQDHIKKPSDRCHLILCLLTVIWLLLFSGSRCMSWVTNHFLCKTNSLQSQCKLTMTQCEAFITPPQQPMKASHARRHTVPYAAYAGGLSWQQNRAPVYSRGPLNSSWRMADYEEGQGGVSLKHIPYAVRKSLIYQPLKFLDFYTSDPPALSLLP